MIRLNQFPTTLHIKIDMYFTMQYIIHTDTHTYKYTIGNKHQVHSLHTTV